MFGVQAIIIYIVVGGGAGFLAGKITKKGSVGMVMNMLIGIGGAIVGTWLLGSVIGLAILGGMLNGIIAGVINAAIGAVAALVILKLIKK